jgi:hypothetical protein
MCQIMFLKWMQFGIHIYNFLLKYMLSSLLILISKSWGCPPWGWACLSKTATHAERGAGGYLFLPGFFPCMISSMDGWRNGWMEGRVTWWKKLHEKRPWHPLLYVIFLQNHQVTITNTHTKYNCILIPQLFKFQKIKIEIDEPHFLQ